MSSDCYHVKSKIVFFNLSCGIPWWKAWHTHFSDHSYSRVKFLEFIQPFKYNKSINKSSSSSVMSHNESDVCVYLTVCLTWWVIPSSTSSLNAVSGILTEYSFLSLVFQKRHFVLKSSGSCSFSHVLPKCTIFSGNTPTSTVILVNVWDNGSSWLNSCRSSFFCFDTGFIIIRAGKWCILVSVIAAGIVPLDLLSDVSSTLCDWDSEFFPVPV